MAKSQETLLSLSTQLAKGYLDILTELSETLTEDEFKEVYTQALAKTVSGLVYGSLIEPPRKVVQEGKKAHIKWMESSFLDAKARIQAAVAAGFQGAIKAYSDMDVEYYCEVKLVPEPLNKEPC